MSSIEVEKIQSLQSLGFWGRLRGYAGLTGPGWLQAGVTLGGGSLAGSLYLGVVAGYSLMWLQPLAMLCGVIMLMALAHVTLSSAQNPFESVKASISPLLAWGWLVSTVIADIVFCTAQSSLGVATVQQNLGLSSLNPYVITVLLSLVAFGSAVLYALGNQAMAKLELILKILVGMVMVSFAGAAGVLLFQGHVDLGAIFAGLVPNPKSLFTPAPTLEPLIAATGTAADYWRGYVVETQRSNIIAAFGSAVGINMTFLLPYTLLRRGWTKIHRELSRVDLLLALFVPFSVATALLVILSASAFHAQDSDILDADGRPAPAVAAGYYKILDQRLASDDSLAPETPATRTQAQADALPVAERRLAAALTNRDAKQLSRTLSPLLGDRGANWVFGVGILAMALSTMMVHMLMNGFAISQAVGQPGKTGPFVIGAAMPALLAIFAPLAWSGDAKSALLIPAAVIATVFLPIAYLAILLLMNSRRVLAPGDRASPAVNGLLLLAAGVATFASAWLLANRGLPGQLGIGLLALLAVIGVIGFWKNQRKTGPQS